MKITSAQLRKIIKEEMGKLTEDDPSTSLSPLDPAHPSQRGSAPKRKDVLAIPGHKKLEDPAAQVKNFISGTPADNLSSVLIMMKKDWARIIRQWEKKNPGGEMPGNALLVWNFEITKGKYSLNSVTIEAREGKPMIPREASAAILEKVQEDEPAWGKRLERILKLHGTPTIGQVTVPFRL